MEVGIPKNTSSLCIFATFRQENNKSFTQNVLLYINILSSYFDHVVVVADVENGDPDTTNLPLNCSINLIPNKGLDFGKFWSVLKVLDKQRELIKKIALINDSCLIVKDLKETFDWGSGKPFWGLTLSIEHNPHIQSYFLVFEGDLSIAKLFEFVRQKDIYSCPSRKDIIDQYEIGLSTFMQKQGIQLQALYDKKNLQNIHVPGQRFRGNHSNIAFFLWTTMLHLGCPILKVKRRNFPNEKRFIDSYIDKNLENKYLRVQKNKIKIFRCMN